LMCIVPISFISVNSTKRSTVLPFDIMFFER
jgi:hypothetical protein